MRRTRRAVDRNPTTPARARLSVRRARLARRRRHDHSRNNGRRHRIESHRRRHLIHYDPWWNPAVERQATDRAHRIGQHKPVFAYKLIAAGTVEERIIELQQRKAELAAGIFEESALSNLDAGEIDRLFLP